MGWCRRGGFGFTRLGNFGLIKVEGELFLIFQSHR